MKRVWFSLAGIALVALVTAGCGVESGTNPVPTVPVGLTVSFDYTSPTVTIPGDNVLKSTGPDFNSPPDSVTITSGVLMLRSVRFNTESVNDVDTVITAADEDDDVSDASVRFHGPYVIEVDGAPMDLSQTAVPVGDYKQVTFVLQKARVTDNLGSHGEMIGSSIVVTGEVWRDGTARTFVFNTDYTSEIAVNGHFRVSESTEGRLHLQFQVGQWFHAGSHWLDPERPANRLRILRNVRSNISGSFEVLN